MLYEVLNLSLANQKADTQIGLSVVIKHSYSPKDGDINLAHDLDNPPFQNVLSFDRGGNATRKLAAA